jgi:hypothetical protein
MSILVPFGIKDGVLYEPRQVLNGKDCGCFCPGCNHPLVARKNAKTPHFAHAAGKVCGNGIESAIHLAAKQLIAERMELALPAVYVQLPARWGPDEDGWNWVRIQERNTLYNSCLMPLSKVSIEPWLDGFRPDIVVVEAGSDAEILVEIAVTHFVDENKLDKIRKRGIRTIEIDVSNARGAVGFDMLNRLLFSVPTKAKWLHHPQAEQMELDYVEKQRQERAERDAAEAARFENYRMLNPQEKIKRNIAKAQLQPKSLTSLTAFVPGENSYDDGRYAWQSAVLAYIANRFEEQGYLHTDELTAWLSKLFDISTQFQDAEKVALWKYLKHLESIGLLKQDRRDFVILMPPKNWEKSKAVQ